MEQNLVSDEELLERINKVLHESKQSRKKQIEDSLQDSGSAEQFQDVSESLEKIKLDKSEDRITGKEKDLVLENHYLSLQLQAEKKKSKELQSKFKLFENSVKYFERLNGQLENIRRTVDDEFIDLDKEEFLVKQGLEAMQKIRPKTVHTASSGIMSSPQTEDTVLNAHTFSEPHTDELLKDKKLKDSDKEEVAFRDAEDFKQLEQGLEIVRDKNETDFEAEKVFITKKEKRCLEDIGNLASRTRTPLDDKHQRFFERDRRRFANSIVMPEIQEVDKGETVPPEIISKTKETPVNITSTELDGLRSYLLQLKELIARRETAWARTTERDYNQRVEITRFKNEVSHLRMLCDKRQRDIKERDQIILSKEDEIRELQKRIQGLRNAIVKLEKKDERFMEAIDGMTNEVLENSQIVQRSYNAMKRQTMMNRANVMSSMNLTKQGNLNQMKPVSRSKDSILKKGKILQDKGTKKAKTTDAATNDEEPRLHSDKSKMKLSGKDKPKFRHRNESLMHKTKETFDKVDEKLQRVEEMLHNEVLKGARKNLVHGKTKQQTETKSFVKNQGVDRMTSDGPVHSKTPSNGAIRQEMLTAMTGLSANPNLRLRNHNFPDNKRSNPTAAVIANALLAARNANLFNY